MPACDSPSCPFPVSSGQWPVPSPQLTLQTDLPDLPNTSLSFIISPKVGITMLKDLFPSPRNAAKEPNSVWLQPGAESDEIEAFIKEHNLSDRIVLGGPCVLVHGDEARELASKL